MAVEAARHLSQQAKRIDALNVFPVPDGDTGTNMSLTMKSGAEEVKKSNVDDIGQMASVFSKGLLMGARGNSGVILSQLFRGFAKGVEGKRDLSSKQFASAFKTGVETAYKAVMKPVEGTMLTVAKDAADQAIVSARQSEDIIQVMKDMLSEAKASLARTPRLLPVLKEVGVVDSGGQGLVIIYEAFLLALEEKDAATFVNEPNLEELVRAEHYKSVQAHVKTEDIRFGYCTEFIIKKDAEKLKKTPFRENDFRKTLNHYGDSLVVVADDDLIKVHIHSESPGELLTYAQTFGELTNIKIENMREQHSGIVQRELQLEKAAYGIVTVAAGEGLIKLFQGLGADEVIFGGQTMNPSTEDIVQAIHHVHAETVFILPNNANIVMAAEQAAAVADRDVIVIPSTSVPQGMASLFAFHPQKGIEENEQAMKAALQRVKSGQVTFAVRDTVVDGVNVKKDDYLSMMDGKIVSTAPSKQSAAEKLLEMMISGDDHELVTIIYGEDTSKEEAEKLALFVENLSSDLEIEVHEGNQPIYSYIFAVE